MLKIRKKPDIYSSLDADRSTKEVLQKIYKKCVEAESKLRTVELAMNDERGVQMDAETNNNMD